VLIKYTLKIHTGHLRDVSILYYNNKKYFWQVNAKTY